MKWPAFVAFGVVLVGQSISHSAEQGFATAGDFQFDFCSIGETRTMSSGENIFVSQYKVIANTRSTIANKAFDRMSALCYGVYSKLNGRHKENGVCELADADGHKWWMDYQGNDRGTGGTYSAAGGTGKYAGMMLKGEYVLDFWPSALKDTVQACNVNRGTYKLAQ